MYPPCNLCIHALDMKVNSCPENEGLAISVAFRLCMTKKATSCTKIKEIVKAIKDQK